MKFEKTTKRLTLREQMTHAEKGNRDLIDHFNGEVLRLTAEFRDLNRPVRRKSSYPTVQTIHNTLQKLEGSGAEGMLFCDYLVEQFEAIRQSALKEAKARL